MTAIRTFIVQDDSGDRLTFTTEDTGFDTAVFASIAAEDVHGVALSDDDLGELIGFLNIERARRQKAKEAEEGEGD